MKIMLVDYTSEECKFLKTIFEPDDYEIFCSDYSKDLLDRLVSDYFGVLLLNIIPEKEDISLKRVQSIRNESMIPIIVMSTKGDNFRKILAFDYGADDYILKSCDSMELRSRVRALYRREKHYHNLRTKSTEIKINDLYVDTLSRKVIYKKENLNLTNIEFDLFLTLISEPNKVFDREKLMEKVWGYSRFGDTRSVDVYIRRIRKKIQDIFPEICFICTKWGSGYYIDDSLI